MCVVFIYIILQVCNPQQIKEAPKHNNTLNFIKQLHARNVLNWRKAIGLCFNLQCVIMEMEYVTEEL